jgi:hypothetical protein
MGMVIRVSIMYFLESDGSSTKLLKSAVGRVAVEAWVVVVRGVVLVLHVAKSVEEEERTLPIPQQIVLPRPGCGLFAIQLLIKVTTASLTPPLCFLRLVLLRKRFAPDFFPGRFFLVRLLGIPTVECLN